VEYGIESTNDETLKRIHRGHDFACARKAIEETASRRIITGCHVILGLPGENRDEILRQATVVSSLPLTILKIHQLQIIRGTRLAQEYAENPFPLFTADEFVSLLVDYIRLLRSDIVLDRFVSQSPPDMLIAPRWGLKPQEFNKLLDNALRKAGEYK
jgi:radical SAM protein (TIGR01212 family)